jgi:hydroxyethylthiazole kinase-like uncharacterized protein yjeF
MVPGGVALTAEAALRAGAGKVRLATVASCAVGLGIALPEVGILALDETPDGHVDISRLAPERLPDNCDALVIGPAMWSKDAAADLIAALVISREDDAESPVFILDAAALGALPAFAEMMRERKHPLILTPHAGELADMTGYSVEHINAAPCAVLREAVETFDAVVMLKGATSYVSAPGRDIYGFAGGGVGLATGGSGDVLAGIVAGLAARGAAPFDALLWAIWLHGEAGRRCAEQIGAIGFLSRELLVRIPNLMQSI